MDYKPRPILSNPTLNKTYKKKRIFWLNSDFNDGFTSNNNKIIDVSFNVPPFQLYNNNNMRVISYIRNDANVSPIIIKLKEPYCESRLITNTDKEGNPIIYTNHTGVEAMTSMSPNFLLIPQQIPRFVFRLDDNLNQLNSDYYFSSVTNGSFFQVSGGSPDDKYLLFNSSGSFILNANLNIDVLVIGGGGGGGSRNGGGGGAGALIYKTNYSLSSGTYTVTIGAGGAGATGYFTPSGQPFGSGYPTEYTGKNGSDTTIVLGVSTIFTAKGGGGGGHAENGGLGNVGGCNGGNTGGVTTAQPAVSALNIPQDGDTYGNKGGIGVTGELAGGGGGGTGGVGGIPLKPASTLLSAGNGGIGKQIPITGTNIYYAGGGGGGTFGSSTVVIPAGIGGIGGGGAGGRLGRGTKAGNGTPNTGSGGGGGGFSDGGRVNGNDDNQFGGDGGSGVVIIKFREVRQEGITPVNNKPPSFMLALELEDIDMKKDNIVSIYR